MTSNSLSDFVAEQKSGGSGGRGMSLSNLSSGFDSLRSKVSASATSSSISDWFSASAAPPRDGDQEPLVEGSEEGGSQGRAKSWLTGENVFGLSRTQRFVGFFGCLAAGLFCFGLASMYIPVLLFKSRKFAALYTLGSSFFIFSFALLWGPHSYVRHLCSAPRLPVTIAYFSTLLATLWSSLWISNTLLTLVCTGFQVAALIWFLLTYIPGGESGLKMMSMFCRRFVRKQANPKPSLLPV